MNPRTLNNSWRKLHLLWIPPKLFVWQQRKHKRISDLTLLKYIYLHSRRSTTMPGVNLVYEMKRQWDIFIKWNIVSESWVCILSRIQSQPDHLDTSILVTSSSSSLRLLRATEIAQRNPIWGSSICLENSWKEISIRKTSESPLSVEFVF